MLFYTLVLQYYLKNGQRKEDDTYLWKKADEKQSSATTMILVDGKETFFPVKLKLQGG